MIDIKFTPVYLESVRSLPSPIDQQHNMTGITMNSQMTQMTHAQLKEKQNCYPPIKGPMRDTATLRTLREGAGLDMFQNALQGNTFDV